MAETWQIIVAAGVLVVGIGIGLLLRPSSKTLRKRAEELETQLAETKESFTSHRREVSKHFEQTSDLFRDLTQQYTALYAHLAEGARTLAPERLIEIGQGFPMPALERGSPRREPDATPESSAELPKLDQPVQSRPVESAALVIDDDSDELDLDDLKPQELR